MEEVSTVRLEWRAQEEVHKLLRVFGIRLPPKVADGVRHSPQDLQIKFHSQP